MIKIGITGGIGSGKSVVCNIFKTIGIPVYDADTRAKTLMNSDESIIKAIISRFGAELYKNGSLDRPLLAGKIFNNKESLEFVNGLVHPSVRRDFLHWSELQDVQYVIEEAALLFESGTFKELDFVATVTCPEEIRIKRVITRDNTTIEKVIERMNNQWPENEKVKQSQFIIQNDGSESLIEQVNKIHNIILH